MTRLLLLDLFCGEGGAAMGYHRAGFEVVGVDIIPQPRYPFTFIQADALALLRAMSWLELQQYAAVHASPPCQAFSALRHLTTREHPDLVADTRDALAATGLPYVIENVPDAPLRDAVMLCGSSLGLDVRRHRLFESNVALLVPPCSHGTQLAPKFLVRESRGRVRRAPATVSVAGNDTHVRRGIVPVLGHGGGKGGIELWREVMGMPWASRRGIAQAIPPIYAELIGAQLLAFVRSSRRETAGRELPSMGRLRSNGETVRASA